MYNISIEDRKMILDLEERAATIASKLNIVEKAVYR
jgi:hypothetical protein